MKRETNLTDALVYSSLQPGKWDLFQIEGLIPHNLTQDESLNYHPVYHPDGRYLIFTSERDGVAHLYYVDTQNKESPPMRLTDNPHFEDQAAFSPAGDLLYFVSTRDYGVADIYVIPFTARVIQNFRDAKNLTNGIGNNLHPDISADGDYMLFSSNREHDAPKISNPNVPKNYRATDIFKMQLTTGNLERLTDSEDWDGSPVWSHDGQTIYFYSTRGESKAPHIYSMTAQGNEIKMLGPEKISAVSPKIAPNGRIAFTAISGNRYSIASMRADGKQLRYETPTRINFYGAFFHPKTAQCIAFGDGPEHKSRPQFVSEPPFATDKPTGMGPFLINHHKRSDLNLYCVRGFFPNYDAINKLVLCIEEFQKVVLIDIDGQTKKTLFEADKTIIGIHWSPDKKWFAASIGNAFTNDKSDIWKISMDGATQENLTDAMPGHKIFPKISSNNKDVVFCSRHQGRMDVYAMQDDGSNLRALTKEAVINIAPAISPDGTKVVYSSRSNEQNYNLYLIGIDGEGEPRRLTTNRYADMHAVFSPDGQSVAFSSERGGLLEETPLIPIFSPQPYGDIYSVRISDLTVTRITESKWENSLPDWQPSI